MFVLCKFVKGILLCNNIFCINRPITNYFQLSQKVLFLSFIAAWCRYYCPNSRMYLNNVPALWKQFILKLESSTCKPPSLSWMKKVGYWTSTILLKHLQKHLFKTFLEYLLFKSSIGQLPEQFILANKILIKCIRKNDLITEWVRIWYAIYDVYNFFIYL